MWRFVSMVEEREEGRALWSCRSSETSVAGWSVLENLDGPSKFTTA